jgi:hypothetical protein
MNMTLHDDGCTDDAPCFESECDLCDPIVEPDVICAGCGEHAELREESGTSCCGSVARFRH